VRECPRCGRLPGNGHTEICALQGEIERLRARNAELLQILQNTAEALGDERDELRVMNAELLTDLDRVLTTSRYLIGIAERGEGRPMAEDETAERFVLGYVKRLEAELAKCKASLAAIYVMADRVSPGTIRDECIAAVPTILDALEGVK
jgi:uncharacterized small protein (DUF1192 family)